MINAVIKKLVSADLSNSRLFASVEQAIDLANAMDAPLKRKPVAYVFEISRRVGGNERDMGPASQRVTTTVGVVIGIPKINDPLGQKALVTSEQVLTATRQALFGFSPGEYYSNFLLGSADTVGVNKHALWKLERFTTEHYEVPGNGTN